MPFFHLPKRGHDVKLQPDCQRFDGVVGYHVRLTDVITRGLRFEPGSNHLFQYFLGNSEDRVSRADRAPAQSGRIAAMFSDLKNYNSQY